MNMSQGMALAPWNVLAGGKIRTDAEEKKGIETGEGGRTLWADWLRSETERTVCAGLEKVAQEIGAKSITSGTCCCAANIHFFFQSDFLGVV